MKKLDRRRRDILWAVIQSHIDLNAPIGSVTISKRFPIGLSPASIRNAMVELEELGYLTQPHTSAGRIPTEKGYRYYAERLLEERRFSINLALADDLVHRFRQMANDNNRIIKEAARTLSVFSNYLALAIPPETDEVFLKRIKFIKYERKKILVILIAQSGSVTNKIIELDKVYSQKQLDTAAAHINSRFTGMTIQDIRERITNDLLRDRMICDRLIIDLLGICKEIIAAETDHVTYDGFSGASNLPDFVTLKQIKEILKALEDRHFVLKLLDQVSGSSGTQVFVGMDHIVPAMKELSMVISTYSIRRKTSGAIGIIGPTRMNYKKVIPVVDYTAKVLTQMLSES